MFIPFEKLAPNARVWIYQADRAIGETERKILNQHLQAFADQWMVHGEPLEASFDIRYDRFVILAANDTTSGCSIDSSVRAMKEAGAAVNIDFFNRNLIAFLAQDKISMIELPLLKTAFRDGVVSSGTLVFNNVASTLQELQNRWLVPAESTWLKRYIASPESVQ